MKYISCLMLLLAGCGPAAAAVLYVEPHGERHQYPLAGLATWQFPGIRFEVDRPALLLSLHTEMGGSSSSFFAALVRLPSVTSLPQGNPFTQDEVLHSTVFNLDFEPVKPRDIPFTVSVDPGAYAIVFGGGILGSSGYFSADMAAYDPAPGSSGFAWVPNSEPLTPWHDVPTLTFNVVVEGIFIPEPSSAILLLGAIPALGTRRFRRRPASRRVT